MSSSMEMMRFEVYGRRIGVWRCRAEWRSVLIGADGKLGSSGVVIPDFIEEAGIGQFLSDLFHESARPGMPDVRRID